MEKALETLKSKIIFTEEDIGKIRSEVTENYPHSSASERAFIFANKVRFKLHASFEGVAPGHVEPLTTHVLSHTLARHHYTIHKHHIFTALANSEMPADERIIALKEWLSRSESISVSAKKLERTIDPKPVSHRFHLKIAMGIALVMVTMVLSAMTVIVQVPAPQYAAPMSHSSEALSIQTPLMLPLPKEKQWFPYRTIDIFKLKAYLRFERNSLLVNTDAVNTILYLAKKYNIDPLLLFAIIGQEQGFVPDVPHTDLRILNNPFNVFHSWEVFNTTLYESTEIAIYTIQKRMATYDDSTAPLLWLNGIYAEDPYWHRGVALLLKRLEEIVGM